MLNGQYFVGVGAQKCGTCWLGEALRSHPDVWFSPLKEVHYFDAHHIPWMDNIEAKMLAKFEKKAGGATVTEARDQGGFSEKTKCLAARVAMRSNEDYVRYFHPAEGKAAFGEITPAYSVLPPKGFQEIRACFPSARVIFLMRDPVARIWSSVRYACLRASDPRHLVEASDLDRFVASRGVVERTRYDRTLTNLFTVFDREEVLVDFYETVFESPFSQVQFLRRVCRHIGVAYHDAMAEVTDRKFNASPPAVMPGDLAQRLRQEFAPVVEGVRRLMGTVPASWG